MRHETETETSAFGESLPTRRIRRSQLSKKIAVS
jgi:hypothetical protein